MRLIHLKNFFLIMKFEYLNSKGARGDVRRQHKCIPHAMHIAVFTDTYRPSTALQSDTICMDQTMSYLFDTATRLWACVRPILPCFNCAFIYRIVSSNP